MSRSDIQTIGRKPGVQSPKDLTVARALDTINRTVERDKSRMPSDAPRPGVENPELSAYAMAAMANAPQLGKERQTVNLPPRNVMAANQRVVGQPTVKVAPASSTQHRPTEVPPENYITEELPSRGLFYDNISSVAIKRFGVPQISLINRSRTDGNFRHTVDAVGSCIWGTDVLDLSLQDFWFLMYWERINSYKNVPLTVDWTCAHTEHLHMIDSGEVDASSTERTSSLDRTDLKIINLDPIAKIKADSIRDRYGITVVPFTVRHFLQYSSLLEEDKKLAESDSLMMRYANILDVRVHGETLLERLEVANSLDDANVIVDIEDFFVASEHGVVESFDLTCEVCGAHSTVDRTLDALSFFPELLRNNITRYAV